jgi:hypothetical protein
MASSAPKRLTPPHPPADFGSIVLDTVEPPAVEFYRVSHEDFPSPLFFSRKGLYRFDSATARWGVCYVAPAIPTTILETFADAIRARRIDFTEFDQRLVWKITIPRGLQTLRLSGATLPKIKATLQSFVSRYSLSQEWGRAFMNHPQVLDGVIYTGRQSGSECLALFGDTDPAKGRAYQPHLRAKALGKISEWAGFYPFLAQSGARVVNLPKAFPANVWR